MAGIPELYHDSWDFWYIPIAKNHTDNPGFPFKREEFRFCIGIEVLTSPPNLWFALSTFG